MSDKMVLLCSLNEGVKKIRFHIMHREYHRESYPCALVIAVIEFAENIKKQYGYSQ